MEQPEAARKTRAIVFSDIRGYSRLMGEDESLALRLLEEHNAICVPLIKQSGGAILKYIGDAILSSFESASDAVHCGIAVQKALALRNTGRPERQQIVVRIGIHIGDVVFKDGDIFGDGVNIAARIEPLAEPGGIAISQTVYDMVKARPEIQTVSLGAKDLKNIKDAVNIYKVLVEAQAPGSRRSPNRTAARWRLLAVLGAAVLATAGAVAVRFSKRRQKISLAAPSNASAASAGIDWVPIPDGSFMMGAENWPDAKPVHAAAMKAFRMAKAPVTFGQYRTCVKAGACTAAHVSDGGCYVYNGVGFDFGSLPESFQGDDQPAVCVDWEQARAFSKWADGRLPTEAEWEYAARSAGKDQAYPWGDQNGSCETAVTTSEAGAGCGRNSTWPVCSKPKGNTKQGLCDVAGNVREWVQDWSHDSYSGAPSDGSAWESPAGVRRIYRGGSWTNGGVYLRSAHRDRGDPRNSYDSVGFRPVGDR